MTSDNVVDISAHRRRTRRRTRRPKEPPAERIACLLLGSMIGILGFGLGLLVLSFGSPAQHLIGLLPAVPLSLIGLFGVNWVIQGIRGRSRHEGIFYAALERLLGIGPRPWSLFVPAVALAALSVAAILDDSEALEAAVTILVGWLILMVHVATHELGHYCAARLFKLNPSRVLVGPADFSRSSDGWELELSRSWWSVFGGWVTLREEAAGLPAKALLGFAAGGPIATGLLLLMFLVLCPVPLLDLFLASTHGVHLSAISAGSKIGAGLLIINLLPFRNLMPGASSDGYQILSAFRQLRRSRRAG